MKTNFHPLSTILQLLIFAGILLAPGCTTTKGVKTAAYVGTSLALAEHPEWRAGFEKADQSLGILENADTISLAEVLAILHQLPVKELKSDKVRIVILTTMLLIEEAGAPEINVVTTEKLRPTIKQLRAGIRLALDTSFADYRSDGTLLITHHASRITPILP